MDPRMLAELDAILAQEAAPSPAEDPLAPFVSARPAPEEMVISEEEAYPGAPPSATAPAPQAPRVDYALRGAQQQAQQNRLITGLGQTYQQYLQQAYPNLKPLDSGYTAGQRRAAESPLQAYAQTEQQRRRALAEQTARAEREAEQQRNAALAQMVAERQGQPVPEGIVAEDAMALLDRLSKEENLASQQAAQAALQESRQEFEAEQGRLDRKARLEQQRIRNRGRRGRGGGGSRRSGAVPERLTEPSDQTALRMLKQDMKTITDAKVSVRRALDEARRQLEETGDVAGTGMTGPGNLIPQALLSDEGRRMRRFQQAAKSAVAKLRSGATLNEQEIAGIEAELGQVFGGSDKDMIGGLEALLENIEELTQVARGGYNPHVVRFYDRNVQRGSKKVKIRQKGTGRVREVSPDAAARLLQSDEYEEVQ